MRRRWETWRNLDAWFKVWRGAKSMMFTAPGQRLSAGILCDLYICVHPGHPQPPLGIQAPWPCRGESIASCRDKQPGPPFMVSILAYYIPALMRGPAPPGTPQQRSQKAYPWRGSPCPGDGASLAMLVLLLARMLLGPGASPSNSLDNFGPSSGGLWDFSSSRSSSHVYHTDKLVCLQGLVQGNSSQRLGFFLLLLVPPPPTGFAGGVPFKHPCLIFPMWGVQVWVGVWSSHGHVLGFQLSPEDRSDTQSQVLCCQGMNIYSYGISSQHIFILVFIQLCWDFLGEQACTSPSSFQFLVWFLFLASLSWCFYFLQTTTL